MSGKQTRNGKMMKTKTLITSMALAGALMAGTVVNANPITGSISINGTPTLNGPFATATADTGNSSVSVAASPTGTFAGLGGTPVTTFAPFAFTGASVSPLWSFKVGTTTYSFDLTTDSVLFRTGSDIVLGGSGTLNVTGLTSTPATWTLSIPNEGSLSFSESTGAVTVPDGGLTVSLLGGTLLGLGAFRRKLGC
jgi:hypothetical protein